MPSTILSTSLTEAKVLVEVWRNGYDNERPHQSLGYKTPQEYKTEWHKNHSQPRAD
ncbi:MAG: transposase [Chthonomonadaceae bacterium]|nr:transposase [Chthonomonadaceae bacterium]